MQKLSVALLGLPWRRMWGFGRIVSMILAGFIAISLIIFFSGLNPFTILTRALRGVLFTPTGILQTLANTAPLILTSITFAVGYRCGLFNISAEGSMMMGAVATIATGGTFHLPAGFHHLVVMTSAILAGLLWNVPVAFLKTRRNVHEVVSTIMMNWTALFFTGFLIAWPLRDMSIAEGTFAIKILPSARFPLLTPTGPLTAVLFIGLSFALIVYILMWHTKVGQHIRATGYNMEAARSAGINTSAMTVYAFGIGGISAALAGCALTAGTPPLWTVTDELSELLGMGFLGIAVAMIGRNHPLWCIPSAFFVSALRSSRFYIQQAGVAPEITDILIGTIILSFALPEIYEMTGRKIRLRLRRKESCKNGTTTIQGQ